MDDLQNFSVADAAKRSSLSEVTIHRKIKSGDLLSTKIGRRRLVPASALKAFLEGEAA